jgi:hypothetical protein
MRTIINRLLVALAILASTFGITAAVTASPAGAHVSITHCSATSTVTYRTAPTPDYARWTSANSGAGHNVCHFTLYIACWTTQGSPQITLSVPHVNSAGSQQPVVQGCPSSKPNLFSRYYVVNYATNP